MISPDEHLVDFIARYTAAQGKPSRLSSSEISSWPDDFVSIIKKHKLLHKTIPVKEVICKKCENECLRPVESITDNTGETDFFLICNRLDDVNRVPVSNSDMEQWQILGDDIASLITTLLKLRPPSRLASENNQFAVGLFKTNKNSAHIALSVSDELYIETAGHSTPLIDLLFIERTGIKIDRNAITRMVNNPRSGGEGIESAEAREERIYRRIEELRAAGNKAFQKTVSEEEEISTSRVKQILKQREKRLKPKKFIF